MDLQQIQLTKSKTYKYHDTTSNIQYYIGLGYTSDRNISFFTWTLPYLPDSTTLNMIKSNNPHINHFYAAIYEYDIDYQQHLINIGFTFVEDSTIGNPPEDCKLYEFV